jgi:four helix bundle protein
MHNGRKNILGEKAFAFAVRVVNLYKFLTEKKKEYVMSKQVLRSGTAIGALLREADFAQSKADFINKLHVAVKEANETEYWLMLLKETNYVDTVSCESISTDCRELLKLLTASIKTAKSNLK